MPTDTAHHSARVRQGGPLKVCLVTDVFPPGSGGSGWSTYYLGKALHERGHRVRVMRPRYGTGIARPGRRVVEYGGLLIEEILVPNAPAWSLKLGVGKAWEETVAGSLLARRAAQSSVRRHIDIIHGQHMVSAVAASRAARIARRKGVRIASVATVRDYWPICPVSTRLFSSGDRVMFECRDGHRLSEYMACVGAAKGGPLRSHPLTVLRWLRTAQAGRELGRCDAVITVSDYVRGEIERSGRVHGSKLVTIPNMLDLQSVDRALRGAWPLPDLSPEEPFLLFVGKWDVNKGAQMLPEIVAESGVRMPVVLAGEGPLRESIGQEASMLGLDFRFYEWLDNDAVVAMMQSARALLFPSAWQEPLSRVLLEGCAAGAAIVALDTGGTGDVIRHGESGWLANSTAGMAEGLRLLANDAPLNRRLRAGARRRAEETFASDHVITRVETLYRRLLA